MMVQSRPVVIDVGLFAQVQGLCAAIWADGNDAKLGELQELLLDLNDQATAIQARADTEKRDLSDDERKEIDSILAQSERTEQDLERRKRILVHKERLSAPSGRKTSAEGPSEDDQEIRAQAGEKPRKTPGYEFPREDRGKGGFPHMGEFLASVRTGSGRGGNIDPRLVRGATPSTWGNEGVGSDGGFAVPPDFSGPIQEKIMGETSLLPRTDMIPTGSNTYTVPKDETSPWDSSNGIQAYWDGEAAAHTQTKPQLTQDSIRLHKLSCLVPVTDEQLEDTPGLGGYVSRKAATKMNFKVNFAIVQGSGVGMPRGILNSPCLVSVAKETSQAADTLVAENIVKMYSRMYAESLPTSVWLVNQDIFPQLFLVTVNVKNVAGSENVGGAPVFMPPGGLSMAPYGMLMGRPIVPTQACETIGDQGDIIFADLMQFMCPVKNGGAIRQAMSLHVWFDYDLMAFKFTLRMGGQASWGQALSPRDGSNTLSPFVTLDAR